MRVGAAWRLLLLGLCLFATSCGRDNAAGPVAPLATPSPSPSITTYTLVSDPRGLVLDTSLLSVQALISPLTGGTISVLGHSLKVPAGAVTVPTLFTMVVLPTGFIEVDLRALLPDLFGTVITTFNKPLKLTLHYRRTTDVVDPSRLVIVHINGTEYEPLRSTVDPTKKTVTAKLRHFSKYAMAQN